MHRPLTELTLARFRMFLREPGVIFWVYGFPLLLAVGLGIAFRNRPVQTVAVAVVGEAPAARALAQRLDADERLVVRATTERDAGERLRSGRADIVLVPPAADGAAVEYRFDRTRPDSVLARALLDDAMQRLSGRRDAVIVRDRFVTQKGARYIDFLVPGLVGMNLMSGGMWGVGFVLVDMRVRKLLKRLIATPMRRRDFLLSLILGRIGFVAFEVAALLVFGWFAFGVAMHGSVLALAAVSFLGAMTFAGMGLAVASRAEKTETVSGLMNVVMLPMFLLSGVFFASSHFPDWSQRYIRLLPLTALNDSLRAVIIDGASLAAQSGRIAVLAGWGFLSFFLALRLFRWR